MIDVGGFLLPVKENSSPSSRSVSGKLGRLVGIDISQILKVLEELMYKIGWREKGRENSFNMELLRKLADFSKL